MSEPTNLNAEAFEEFFRVVHGFPPFPWQKDLVRQVLDRGEWPSLVDIPTGMGKTAMLDVSLFVLAATAHQAGADRLGRRRCFFVVDRRIVVDEAYTHARKLVEVLTTAGDGVVRQVAEALQLLAPDAGGPLVSVARMRGGASWASAWLDRPDRPAVVLGTVDQVGSRLFFRGYGASPRRAPIDAAFVGTDSLLLLDEAHLSRALLRTVRSAQERDALGVPVPGLDVVQLSATGDKAPDAWGFDLDVDAHRAVGTAWRRLTAPKILRCLEAPKSTERAMVDAALESVHALTSLGGWPPTVLIVCNTVDRARAVHAELQARKSARKDSLDADCELLIGRCRGVSKGDVQRRVLELFGSKRARADRPAVLVATQTVEVGVNLDVDALVTESASWDALVQRFGRLDRLGDLGGRIPGGTATVVVVHDGRADGPVYGQPRDNTWRRLVEMSSEGLDVSPLNCRELVLPGDNDLPDGGFVRRAGESPVLMAPILDAWVQTAPIPMVDPPVQPFLHGFDSGSAAVQVAWRDRLVEPDLASEDDVEVFVVIADSLLTAVPVRADEIVEVPFVAVRRWMNGEAPGVVADIEAADGDPLVRSKAGREPFRALVWRADDTGDQRSNPSGAWRWIGAGELRPGDQVVVPCQRGGHDQFGWAPAEPLVADVSEPASFSRRRGAGVLWLDDKLADRLHLGDEACDRLADLIKEIKDPGVDPRDASAVQEDILETIRMWLPGLPAENWGKDRWSALRRWLDSPLSVVNIVDPSAEHQFSTGDQPVIQRLLKGKIVPEDQQHDADHVGVDDDEVAASSGSDQPVTLKKHLNAVGARAQQIADAIGLPDDLVRVLRDAARWHDLGKCEKRFQVMLHDGDVVEAEVADWPLAKSGMDPSDRGAFRRAAVASGLPRGARHEAWSAALVEKAMQDGYDGDIDLLLHLVASHHGHARPWLPLVVDDHPSLVRADIDGTPVEVWSGETVSLSHPTRFVRLNRHYGRWGLALLESIVRCADQTVSGEGS
ncbi:MAG: type I-U CRISPR-associated helicase/endonuclease Cas3 [Micrococcales bacterium]|nr:type I-U CRISPR-associated helicase/endonuclease Cas3 [Micrococcales bacterium]